MSMIRNTTLGLAAALAFASSQAAAATVVNGSFEQDAGAAQNGQQFNTLANGGGSSWNVFDSLPGWHLVTGSGIEVQTASTLGTIDPQDGNHYLELDSYGNSMIAQTISFANVGSYVLSFFYSPRTDNAASNIIDYALLAGNEPWGTVLSGSVTGPSNGSPLTQVGLWTEIKTSFNILKAGDYALKFSANGTNDSYGGLIDNVSIAPAAVPVPAAGLLLLGALGGLAALRRRKSV